MRNERLSPVGVLTCRTWIVWAPDKVPLGVLEGTPVHSVPVFVPSTVMGAAEMGVVHMQQSLAPFWTRLSQLDVVLSFPAYATSEVSTRAAKARNAATRINGFLFMDLSCRCGGA